jgi:hypothetical protein
MLFLFKGQNKYNQPPKSSEELTCRESMLPQDTLLIAEAFFMPKWREVRKMTGSFLKLIWVAFRIIIGKPIHIDPKKFMRNRCNFCLSVIPKYEEGTITFVWYFNSSKLNIGQACPECGKFFVVNDREKLISIFRDALRRKFPVVPQRGLFEQEALESMNGILDFIQDYEIFSRKEVNP